jgi:membrane protease YdiL (CAAX protease family)
MVGAVLAYLVTLFAVSVALYFVGLTLVPGAAQSTFSLIALGVAEGAALGVVLLVWRLVDRRPLQQLGLHAQEAPRRWIKGAVIGSLMMGFIVLVGYTLIDGAAWTINPDPRRASVMLVGGFLGFLIQGPAEEVLFRGYLFENLRGQWGLPWATLISSLAFALLHANNPAFGPLPFVNLVLFGGAAALYKARVDNGQLWGVFAIHTVWNWLQQVVFGLPNSGMASLPENALFTVSPNLGVPDAISGGGFGPEGTLAATLVLLALIGACLRRPTQEKSYELNAISD